MIYTCINYPIPGLVHVFVYSDSHLCLNHQNKIEGIDQESTQSSTTTSPRYQRESDNATTRHHKREPRGQPFPSR